MYNAGDIVISIGLSMLFMRWLRRFLETAVRLPRWNPLLSYIWAPGVVLFVCEQAFGLDPKAANILYLLIVTAVVLAVLLQLKDHRPARSVLLAIAPLILYQLVETGLTLVNRRLVKTYDDSLDAAQGFAILWLGVFLWMANRQKKVLEKERLLREQEAAEKRRIEAQNAHLERLVAERTINLTQQAEELRRTLAELQITQAQLIQAEKMASLGELTAGIAHEIQNPLNFVNNFAAVSVELCQEAQALLDLPARSEDDEQELRDLLTDVSQNQAKIVHHGQRAASIVRGMLEHSRASTGERVETDLNALADEYLRLAYHGLRAKDKTFNATLKTDFDPQLGAVPVVPQDLGRVLLNLLTNAFYATAARRKADAANYQPIVTVSTSRADGQVLIRVQDNGTGIPESARAKIFQPFFTTKPTGEGTGLGLSLSYDIVTQGHGGTLTVDTREGVGTTFTVALPAADALTSARPASFANDENIGS